MLFQITEEQAPWSEGKHTYSLVNLDGGWDALNKVQEKEELKAREERVKKMNENKLSTKYKKAKKYVVKRSKQIGKQIDNLFD